MSSSNIKFQMHLTVKSSGNVFYVQKSPRKSENLLRTVLGIIFLTGLLNSLSNKVFQIKSFFYKVLLIELSFPTNIGDYINS